MGKPHGACQWHCASLLLPLFCLAAAASALVLVQRLAQPPLRYRKPVTPLLRRLESCKLPPEPTPWDAWCVRLERVCVDQESIILHESKFQQVSPCPPAAAAAARQAVQRLRCLHEIHLCR